MCLMCSEIFIFNLKNIHSIYDEAPSSGTNSELQPTKHNHLPHFPNDLKSDLKSVHFCTYACSLNFKLSFIVRINAAQFVKIEN